MHTGTLSLDKRLTHQGYEIISTNGSKAHISQTVIPVCLEKKEGAGPKDTSGGRKRERELVHFDGTMPFSLEDLLRASAELMGKSSYGNYYKAILENGGDVAVMRMGGKLAKNQREVEDKLNLLGKTRHENLMTIRAYYMSSDETLFVYDYMPKGNLAAFLHGKQI
ncbi:putative protein kinase RLK-Pelle-LRR-III family [Helianthus annuus]|nr:putative protein kinase RLK-Pelle-LRR-III family [Helianthus annuus]